MNLSIVFQLISTLPFTKEKQAVLFEKCQLNDDCAR
jgi:hypothetical protein